MAKPQLKTFFKTLKTDTLGQIFLTGILDAKSFSKINVELIQTGATVPNLAVTISMGKISGTTLAAEIDKFSLGTNANIHTYEVVGPEFSLVITGGPPNTNVSIQGWVFLH